VILSFSFCECFHKMSFVVGVGGATARDDWSPSSERDAANGGGLYSIWITTPWNLIPCVFLEQRMEICNLEHSLQIEK
jgi:hypothetical protein